MTRHEDDPPPSLDNDQMSCAKAEADDGPRRAATSSARIIMAWLLGSRMAHILGLAPHRLAGADTQL
ncbi:hypothetical protein ASE61_05135 [Bosea sp. Root670]|nr:hypothetical protein ASE61_05135 [Bosea sp. Root670]